jgi:hypothetical protein
MNTNTPRRRAAVLALAAVTLMALSACAPSAPASTPDFTSASTSSTPTKEAGVFTKNLQVCIDNNSGATVSLDWVSGVSTNGGSGTLEVGQSFCGEGPEPKVGLTFADAFATYVLAVNPAIGRPTVFFNSLAEHPIEICGEDMCTKSSESDATYASSGYAEGQSVGSNIEGHNVSVTRNANNDWVNFTVTILD